jgi:methanogenic corrinoid protein MtbC1
LILDLVKNGEKIADIYEHIFIITQYEVGLLWQTNKITVAHEHFCTAATQDNMSALYPYISADDKKEAKILACTVAGDTHEIGIRMVSDYFEMNGWDCYYLGANMPDINIISAAKEQQVNVLGISVTMPYYLGKVKNLIKKIKNDEALRDLKILVGGYPFTLVPNLWKRVGAHGWARDAREAVALGNGFLYNTRQ